MAVEYRNVPELAEPPGYTHVATGHGSLVFTAGAVPIDETGELVGENDVVLQAERVMANLLKQLEEGGAGPQDVVKTTVYLTDMSNHGPMNEVYREFFPSEFPARTTVEVSALAPAVKGEGRPFLVEIDAVAIVTDHKGDT